MWVRAKVEVLIQKFKYISAYLDSLGPVSWGSRIHRLHLCLNECPVYDTK